MAREELSESHPSILPAYAAGKPPGIIFDPRVTVQLSEWTWPLDQPSATRPGPCGGFSVNLTPSHAYSTALVSLSVTRVVADDM